MGDVREAIRGEPVVLDKAWAVQVEAAELYKALSKLLSSLDDKTISERAVDLLRAILKRVSELVDEWINVCEKEEYVSPSRMHACKVARRVIERIDRLLSGSKTFRLMLDTLADMVVESGDTKDLESITALAVGVPNTLSAMYDAVLSEIEDRYNKSKSYTDRTKLTLLAWRTVQVLSKYAEDRDELRRIVDELATRVQRLEDTLVNDMASTVSGILSGLGEAEKKLEEITAYGDIEGLDESVSKKCASIG